MCHHNHHAEQERESVEVDRAVGFFGRDRADRHHQRRTGQRDAGPIKAETRDAAQRHPRVGENKDCSRSKRSQRHHSAACARPFFRAHMTVVGSSFGRQVSGIANQNNARPAPAIAASVRKAAL